MNEKQRDYIIKHWKKYNLTDTKEEFVALLNILESYGETIDSLHNTTLNDTKVFCGIVGEFANDRDTVAALFEFNTFLETPGEVAAVIYDKIEYYRDCCDYTQEEINAEIKATFCDDIYSDEKIDKTRDGYVYKIAY